MRILGTITDIVAGMYFAKGAPLSLFLYWRNMACRYWRIHQSCMGPAALWTYLGTERFKDEFGLNPGKRSVKKL